MSCTGETYPRRPPPQYPTPLTHQREDAIRPWNHRSWIFPRDPDFAVKAGPVLDLYHRRWNGKPLGPGDFVLSADEKTQIQLITPRDPIVPTTPGRALRVSSDYRRHGTCAYLAA